MVNSAQHQYRYYTTTRDKEVDDLLRGDAFDDLPYVSYPPRNSLGPRKTGVLVTVPEAPSAQARPLALVCREELCQRLCARYAIARPDFSPLTTWCHLLTPSFVKHFDGVTRRPRFHGTEAAWSGLVVAEAHLLSGRPIERVPLSACLASASFAIGRTSGLWPRTSVDRTLAQFQAANRVGGRSDAQAGQRASLSAIRSALVPMWKCLSSIDNGNHRALPVDLLPLVRALDALHDARVRADGQEADRFVEPLLDLCPQARELAGLHAMVPESRLALFDALVHDLRATDPDDHSRRNVLALACGYLATVAAGGASSLALVAEYTSEFPELTGWAFLVGGIGERTTWASGFDGLGRLVARELMRPLRLDDPPTCDIALDEAVVLADNELEEPLVHLRIKHARVLTVALFPGVNVTVPIPHSEQASPAVAPEDQPELPIAGPNAADSMAVLADMLWPHLRNRVIDATTSLRTTRRRAATRPDKASGAAKPKR
ncbi:MAG: hypothetical protein F4Y01_09990 [Gammaproteobacteria bacterium]|nr:hypothetical protein [Gammaproteobacteria bacterium]